MNLNSLDKNQHLNYYESLRFQRPIDMDELSFKPEVPLDFLNLSCKELRRRLGIFDLYHNKIGRSLHNPLGVSEKKKIRILIG